MKAFGDDSKAILDYSKGRAPQSAAEKAVGDLKARNAKMLAYFSDRSTSTADMPGVSNAKPEIWSEKRKFAAYFATLATQLDAQAKLIKAGQADKVGAAQAEMGKTSCGGCHGEFRAKMTR